MPDHIASPLGLATHGPGIGARAVLCAAPRHTARCYGTQPRRAGAAARVAREQRPLAGVMGYPKDVLRGYAPEGVALKCLLNFLNFTNVV